MAKKTEKVDKYRDNGITYLEVWDAEKRVFRYKLDANGNFIMKEIDDANNCLVFLKTT